jgi:pimeloyl-ACP methyl ester carboxylesterase
MSEITDEQGVRIDYVVTGDGVPALVLHGAYSTRDEVIPVFGGILSDHGMRGVYPDLPGMGASSSSTAMTCAQVLDALDALIAAEIGDSRCVVIGHSFGAHLARGVAARHPDQVAGLALVSPYVRGFEGAPHRVVEDDGAAELVEADVRDEYLGYFQVRTAETRERFERNVRPALGRYDAAAVERIMTDDALDPDPDAVPYGGPAVIVVGRDDTLLGWRAQRALADSHARGTFVIAADAGHALVHERPALVRGVIEDWLDRVGDLADG